MSESFLYYIWQYQYFERTEIRTADGIPVTIFHTGIRNSDGGPDFANARIRIGDVEWVGNVEIHINASDWYHHEHDSDAAYDNVILHVVWKNDKPVKRRDGSILPTFELKDRVSHKLLLHYRKLINNPAEISCAESLSSVSNLLKVSVLDKVLVQRLEHKAVAIEALLTRNRNDWEETCYQLLARNFGFKVNSDPFFQLALTLPYKILLKHSDQLLQLEALLFGQAGLLDNESATSEYHMHLIREFRLLSTKYLLTARRLNACQWKFHRLRPANFPSLRIAQMAALLHVQKNLFSKVIAAKSYQDLRSLFNVSQSEYWRHHYNFGKPASEMLPPFGEASIANLVINTCIPLMVAFGRSKDREAYIDRAMNILLEMPSENNTLIRRWASLGWKSQNAFDSQALIELYNNLCSKKRCLDCNIGVSILKSADTDAQVSLSKNSL